MHMPYAKTSLRAEQRVLREKMRALGMSHRQIAVEFARRYGLRPRAAWRHAYGWSQTQAAEQISTYAAHAGVSPDGATVAMTGPHLSEYENWPGDGPKPTSRRPTPYLLSLLAGVYRCTVHDLMDSADYEHMPPADRLLLGKSPVSDRQRDHADQDTGIAGRAKAAVRLAPPPPSIGQSVASSQEIAEGDSRVQRREFLAASAAAAVGALTEPPQFAYLAAGRRIGADMPEMLARRLSRLRRLDNYLGGSETYGLYAAELEATKTLTRDAACTQQTRQQLLAIISEQAQLAGWAAFDASWQQTARILYRESLDAARAAGSQTLEGNALALLAYQNLTTGAPATALAEAACQAAGPGTPPAVRALLHERRAWVIAHDTTRPGAARKALDIAAAALQERDAGHAPDWAAWVDHTELQIMSGRCLTRLGQPLAAIPVLHRALAGFDDAQARDKALYMSWLAEAYLDAGEIGTAAAVASDVLALSAGIASARPAQRLHVLVARLEGHSVVPSVADLLDQISSVMPTTMRPG